MILNNVTHEDSLILNLMTRFTNYLNFDKNKFCKRMQIVVKLVQISSMKIALLFLFLLRPDEPAGIENL